MEDRLGELLGGEKQPTKVEGEKDLELQELSEKDSKETEFMKEFFQEVNAIKVGMGLIKRNIGQIEEVYGESIAATNAEKGSKSSEELEKLIDATNLAARDVRTKLKEMDKENKKLEKGTAEFRIRTSMHGTLTKKFLDVMAEYQEIQTKYKNKFRERVERQYKIVKPNATQEEIEQALESGNTQVFADQILDTKHAAAKDALVYIENRHREILRLEQSIKELHQLFVDMAILVEAQGELIDQIEYNVSQSRDYVKRANEELRLANKYQKKSRKKMFILICCLLIVLALVVGLGGILGGVFGTHA